MSTRARGLAPPSHPVKLYQHDRASVRAEAVARLCLLRRSLLAALITLEHTSEADDE